MKKIEHFNKGKTYNKDPRGWSKIVKYITINRDLNESLIQEAEKTWFSMSKITEIALKLYLNK